MSNNGWKTIDLIRETGNVISGTINQAQDRKLAKQKLEVEKSRYEDEKSRQAEELTLKKRALDIQEQEEQRKRDKAAKEEEGLMRLGIGQYSQIQKFLDDATPDEKASFEPMSQQMKTALKYGDTAVAKELGDRFYSYTNAKMLKSAKEKNYEEYRAIRQELFTLNSKDPKNPKISLLQGRAKEKFKLNQDMLLMEQDVSSPPDSMDEWTASAHYRLASGMEPLPGDTTLLKRWAAAAAPNYNLQDYMGTAVRMRMNPSVVPQSAQDAAGFKEEETLFWKEFNKTLDDRENHWKSSAGQPSTTPSTPAGTPKGTPEQLLNNLILDMKARGMSDEDIAKIRKTPRGQ